MYCSVDLIVLCPSCFFTSHKSLHSWYSVVPFQCRKVCKCIFKNLGLLYFCASAFLMLWMLFLKVFGDCGNTLFVFLLRLWRSAMVLSVIVNTRSLLFFDACM